MNLKKYNSILSLSYSWQGAVSDIAFLLIIFFILTATFGLNRIIEIEKKSSNVSINNQEIITIRLKSDGSLYFNEKLIKIETLRSLINTKSNYILKIGDFVKYKNFISILDLFEEKKITKFQIGK